MCDKLRSMNFFSVSVGSAAVADVAATILKGSGGYLVDPHTGVGVAGMQKFLLESSPQVDSGTPLLCMACAHPAKFPSFLQQVRQLRCAHSAQ